MITKEKVNKNETPFFFFKDSNDSFSSNFVLLKKAFRDEQITPP